MVIARWMDRHIEEVLLIVLSTVMLGIIGVQIFMRFILGSSLGWSEELARYCFIWLVFIGVSYGVKKQRHIKVDVVLLLLKEKGKVVLNMVSNIIFLLFAVSIAVYGLGISFQIFGWGQLSPSLGAPMGAVYLAAPVGMLLTAIRITQQLIKQIKYLKGHSVDEREIISDRMTDNYDMDDEQVVPNQQAVSGQYKKKGEGV
ncbi:TRAP transporter small permease [Marinococcus sp. PL1-022]|uniref:TRAP transporter small permease n=1 Tax=Marinococcus sp. PL1-022 TaxID=3095363 RepID=UPI0029C15ADB|nr:TRAP transporter small permease [Marinococcus sp. PL1-022]MDX6151524.1 TRAP transporter small permease [Marinococcus sp. PL1-022]